MRIETDLYDLKLENYDIHSAASLVKSFLRELPDPLLFFPPKQREEYVRINNPADRLIKLKHQIKMQPKENRDLLKFIVKHCLKYVYIHKY